MTTTYDRRHSPNRLYRNPDQGLLLGVCAGIADYFGLNAWTVRIAAVLALIFFTLPALLGYFAAGALLPRRPERLYADPDEATFWRSVRIEPGQTVRDLDYRFRDLERRLRAIEAHVTSREFELDRQIRDLE